MSQPTIIIAEVDKTLTQEASMKVIDVLSSYPPEVKIAALHNLIETFPIPYVLEERSG